MLNSVSYKTQFLAAICASMGAFSLGTIIGFSSPAGAILSDYNDPSLKLSDAQMSWFSSALNLGALTGGLVGGFLINAVGRRGAMLYAIIPWLVGWVLIVAAQNFSMLILGRLLTGLSGGAGCVMIPTYIGEFSSPKIRGLLGTFFQLNVNIGIIFVFCMGAAFTDSFRWIGGICMIFPCLFFLGMIFNKESPNYLLSKGKEEEAKKCLQYYRGKNYNITPEFQQLKETIDHDKHNKVTFRDLKAPYILRPLLISLGLMFFQQVSGINAVLFNLQTIFLDAGSNIGENLSTILVGLVLVGATFISAMLMDRLGRKLLLLLSSSIMVISLVALGVFFFLKERALEHPNSYDVDNLIANLGWLPLLSLIVYVFAFSIGYGPIPWLIMGELFSSDVKEISGSLAASFNWTMSFIVTVSFNPIKNIIDNSGSYWLFAALNVASFIFVLLFVWETKGKTIEEISAHFGAPAVSKSSNEECVC